MLGISVYPLQSSVEENKTYLKIAADLGYKRVFTSMLELDKEKDKALQQVEQYRAVMQFAKELGMIVIIDVNPEVLEGIGIHPMDLGFFAELGASGLRLDGMFNGFYESYMTFNKHDLIIEVNGSFDTGYINNIVDLKCRKSHLWTCHNFYPEALTGLSKKNLISNQKRHEQLGLRTAAFVHATNGGLQGPWAANDGLCTLEEHRSLPIEVQAQELYALGIEDVIIGNAFATKAELEALAALEADVMILGINQTTDHVFKEHFVGKILQNRWDSSDYVIRNFNSRKELKAVAIRPEANEATHFAAGSVLINNDHFTNYKGELLITLQEVAADQRRNYVGRIHEDYRCLLPYVSGGTRFKLKEV